MIIRYLSDLLIKPGKAPVFDDPKNYGLDYEDVSFTTSDGVKLSGWLIKGGNKKVIIQTHFGIQSCRCGFTLKDKSFISRALWNKDIHFLNQAKYLVDAGYSVLMYDMRHHGKSGPGVNDWITYGEDERHDVIAAVEYIANRAEYKKAHLGLLSICMGAAATTFAYGLEKDLQKNKNLKAMVAVQPLTYDDFLKALGLPKIMINQVNKFNKEQRNIDLTGKSFLPYAKDITIPTLLVQNQNDPMTNMNMVKQFYKDLTVEKEMLWLDIEKKRGAAYDWIGKNPDKILGWFDKYL